MPLIPFDILIYYLVLGLSTFLFITRGADVGQFHSLDGDNDTRRYLSRPSL